MRGSGIMKRLEGDLLWDRGVRGVGVGIRRRVSHNGLVAHVVLSRLLGQVLPLWASTIRLWLKTASPMAPWKCLNPR